jgi:hypothetical protein
LLDFSAFFSPFEEEEEAALSSDVSALLALLSFALEELASLLVELLLLRVAGVASELELEVLLLDFAAGVEAEVALWLEVVADGFGAAVAEDLAAAVAAGEALALAVAVAAGEAVALALAVGATDDVGAAEAVGAADADGAAVGAVDAALPVVVEAPTPVVEFTLVRLLLAPTPTEMPTEG